MKTIYDVKAEAVLCAKAMFGDESDCPYPAGTAAHTIWLAAFNAVLADDDSDEYTEYCASLPGRDFPVKSL